MAGPFDLTSFYIKNTYQRILQISGSNNTVLDGTGSLVNLLNITSSTALSASYATTASYTLSSSFATSASQAITSSYTVSSSYSVTASYTLSSSFSTSSSYAISASYAISSSGSISASFANTASYVKLLAGPNITINYQIDGIAISGSASSGSSLPGGGINTIQFNTGTTFSGSNNFTFISSSNIVILTGSMIATSFTGSFFGTSSWAATASYITSSNVYGPFGSNSILSSSRSVTASYADYVSKADLKLFAYSRTPNTSSTTGEQILASVLVPANTLNINDSVEIWADWFYTSTNNSREFSIRLNSSNAIAGSSRYMTTGTLGATTRVMKGYARIVTTGSAYQEGVATNGGAAINSSTAIGLITSSFSLSSDMYIIFTTNLTAADTGSLRNYDIRINRV